jgi:hypothetical protein
MAAQRVTVGLATGGEHGGRSRIDGSRADPSNPRPTLAEAGIGKHLDVPDLGELFGIDLAPDSIPVPVTTGDYRGALDVVAFDVIRGPALAGYIRPALRPITVRGHAPTATSRRRPQGRRRA